MLNDLAGQKASDMYVFSQFLGVKILNQFKRLKPCSIFLGTSLSISWSSCFKFKCAVNVLLV